ncbi:hypothetical protein [Aureimonas sp. ME7]|uniref:MAE_28990/MAE_18760 family HEPN-like nuclease n=1 Tax=Aureimonas sp. ME7 TaxID=2744252 RepID=UPI0015FE1EFA|nr:hypothetical protein [Aureimonas sp. ME7]
MSALEDFNSRVANIRTLLLQLQEYEKRQRNNRRHFAQTATVIVTLRASAYVMMYNAVEAVMRRTLSDLRGAIVAEGVSFRDASEFWRLDALQAQFLRKMQAGYAHGAVLKGVVPMAGDTVKWDEDGLVRLPFSGNFGKTSAIKLKEQLGLAWDAPAGTRGGDDLDNIRKRRNMLAHGLETFAEAGSQTTGTELTIILKRVSTFMVSYISAVETYRANRGYVSVMPLLPGIDEDLQESGDSDVGSHPDIAS